MKRKTYLFLTLAFTLIFATLTARAQVPAQDNRSTKNFKFQPSPQAFCPVELKASLDVSAKLILIKDQSAWQPSRKLTIDLENPRTASILNAQISVHGFPMGARAIPAVLYFGNNPAEISQALAFNRQVEAGRNASMEFWLQRFSTVSSIELDSVTYADGTSWTLPIARAAESLRMRPFTPQTIVHKVIPDPLRGLQSLANRQKLCCSKKARTSKNQMRNLNPKRSHQLASAIFRGSERFLMAWGSPAA